MEKPILERQQLYSETAPGPYSILRLPFPWIGMSIIVHNLHRQTSYLYHGTSPTGNTSSLFQNGSQRLSHGTYRRLCLGLFALVQYNTVHSRYTTVFPPKCPQKTPQSSPVWVGRRLSLEILQSCTKPLIHQFCLMSANLITQSRLYISITATP